MRSHLIGRQAVFAADMRSRLAGTLAELERLQNAQIHQLELQLAQSAQAASLLRPRFEQRSRAIHKVFDDYRRWVEDTLTTEPLPWLQVAAALHA